MNKYTITNIDGNTLEVQELELDNHKVRVAWDNVNRTFYFSVVDVVGVLTEQLTTRNATYYWGQIKTRLKKEGANELFTNCQQLKLRAADGNAHKIKRSTGGRSLSLCGGLCVPKSKIRG